MRTRSLFLTLLVAAAALCATGSCATSDKSYPVFTPDNLSGSMKLVGLNFAAVNVSLGGKDFDGAKAQLVHTRELLAVTITFWRVRNKADAIQILRDTLTKMDDLDAALSGETVDPAHATAMATQIGAHCQACHAIYRELNPGTKIYHLKAGPTP